MTAFPQQGTPAPEPRGQGDHRYALWDAAYVLGSLSDVDRREFEAHLGECASCRDAVTELSGMPALLSLLDREEITDEDEVAAVRSARPRPVMLETAAAPDRVDVQASLAPPAAVGYAPETVFPIFRTGNYAPVPDELTAFDLPVEGAIPAELNGWYLRNGPNPREAAGHWCTGDGMIHGVRLENGRAAWYRNRWVRTESFERAFPVYNPDGSRNLHSSIANTHVVRHAGKTLALMEFALPYEITNDLKTLGAYDFGGKLRDSMTAHPKICPITGELHFFGCGNIFEPHVTYHRANADGELIVNRPLDVPGLTLMHDFALTAEHVVFMDLPLVFNLRLALAQQDERSDLPYRWDDHYGARLGVLRRDDPYGPVRWFDIDPCYVFHIANAYDARSAGGGSIVLEVVRYPEMWRNSSEFQVDAALWRWTIDLDAGDVAETQLDERAVEFPRVDDRLVGTAARYSVAVSSGTLVRYDLERDTASEHRFGHAGLPGAPGEAVFAPSPGLSDESSGWYLTYVYDPARDGSDLVIIDASDFEGAPVARVRLPRRVPHGFHGNWIPD
ncbi:MAG: carotenoid oxygenase family protein [Mycobacterium sp.]|uniref:carotenoid oxygenase family protein n=1 Tax=Mycobacterium sp. TaxID=1785 RepID=UPI0026285EEA|nr:carotenoid oxygenase family protein [Mycobacterium sp.]MDI3314665.1 carotenoid oxygenase family protein [Mycobacterium sp.]